MKTEDVTHTPLPWHADGRCIQAQDGNIGLLNLARDDRTSEANAAFIVRAVNSHQALVDALEEATEALRRAVQHVPANAVNMDIALNSPIEDARTLGHCQRVLAKSSALLRSAQP
jgi:hypothetical protein